MKRAIVQLALCAAPVLAPAQDLPKLSPLGKVEQIVGLTKVTIEYSRPSARGRKVFGELVPYDSLWRTGANKCTTIEFSGPVKLEGLAQPVPEGRYSLFTVPGPNSWKILLSTDTELSGTDGFDPKNVIAQFKVPPVENPFMETFTMTIDNVVNDSCSISLRWAQYRVSFNVFADCTDQAMRNIRAAVADPKADFRVFNNCAAFCVERKVMLQDALKWAEKSVQMEEKYWNVSTLAKAYAANGSYERAVLTGKHCIELASAAKASSVVRSMQQQMEEWTSLSR